MPTIWTSGLRFIVTIPSTINKTISCERDLCPPDFYCSIVNNKPICFEKQYVYIDKCSNLKCGEGSFCKVDENTGEAGCEDIPYQIIHGESKGAPERSPSVNIVIIILILLGTIVILIALTFLIAYLSRKIKQWKRQQ